MIEPPTTRTAKTEPTTPENTSEAATHAVTATHAGTTTHADTATDAVTTTPAGTATHADTATSPTAAQPTAALPANTTPTPPTEATQRPHSTPRFALALDWALVLTLSALAIWANARWFAQGNSYSPNGDSAMHLAEVSSFCQTLDATPNLLQLIGTVWTWHSIYPAGTYLVTWLTLHILPAAQSSLIPSLLAFIPILFAALYFLNRSNTRPYWQEALAGVSAIFLTVCLPAFVSYQHEYLLDFPQSVMAVAIICLLVHSESFTRRGFTYLFGLTLGYGMLVKYTVIWFVGLPILWVIATTWRTWKGHAHHLATQLATAAAILFSLHAITRLPDKLTLNLAHGANLLTTTGTTVIIATIIMCLAWWYLAGFTWRGPILPALTNFSRSLALAALVAAPWFITNWSIIQQRSQPVIGDIHDAIARLSEFSQFFADAYSNMFSLALLAIALLLAILKRAEIAHRLAALGAVSGTVITYVILGVSRRYVLPTLALNSTIVTQAARFVPGGIVAIFLISLAISYTTFWHPYLAAPNRGPEENRLVLAISNWTGYSAVPHSNDSNDPFSLALELCPKLLECLSATTSTNDNSANSNSKNGDTANSNSTNSDPTNSDPTNSNSTNSDPANANARRPVYPLNIAILANQDDPATSDTLCYAMQAYAEWHQRRFFVSVVGFERGQLQTRFQLPYLRLRSLVSYLPQHPDLAFNYTGLTPEASPNPATGLTRLTFASNSDIAPKLGGYDALIAIQAKSPSRRAVSTGAAPSSAAILREQRNRAQRPMQLRSFDFARYSVDVLFTTNHSNTVYAE